MSAQTKTVWIQALAALKGPSHKNFCFAPIHLIGLEIVRDAFLAPRLSWKMPKCLETKLGKKCFPPTFSTAEMEKPAVTWNDQIILVFVISNVSAV